MLIMLITFTNYATKLEGGEEMNLQTLKDEIIEEKKDEIVEKTLMNVEKTVISQRQLINKTMIACANVGKKIERIADPELFILSYFTNPANLIDIGIILPKTYYRYFKDIVTGHIKQIPMHAYECFITMVLTFYRTGVYRPILSELGPISAEWVQIFPDCTVTNLLLNHLNNIKPRELKQRFMQIDKLSIKNIKLTIKDFCKSIKNDLNNLQNALEVYKNKIDDFN